MFVAASVFAFVRPARAARPAFGGGASAPSAAPAAVPPGTAAPAVAVTAATGSAAVSFVPVAVEPALSVLGAVALPVSFGR